SNFDGSSARAPKRRQACQSPARGARLVTGAARLRHGARPASVPVVRRCKKMKQTLPHVAGGSWWRVRGGGFASLAPPGEGLLRLRPVGDVAGAAPVQPERPEIGR